MVGELSAPDRLDTPYVGDEKTVVLGWLDWHRSTLAHKCAGLSDEQLRARAVPPSSMSLLGLVRHMAEVERGWFRIGVAQEPISYIWVTDDDMDAEFDHVDTADVREAMETWQAEIEMGREIVAARPDWDVTHPNPRRGDVSLRWVMVHMVEEYARHNGHADLLRERVDGATGW